MNSNSSRKSDLFVSIIAPVHNAGRYIEAYVREVSQVLSSNFKDYEIVLIDDCSHDETVARIQSLQAEVPNLQLYCLARRIGLESAYVVGLERAIGDVIITMDACSDPAAPVMELIHKFHTGHELVYGLREDRFKHEGVDFYQWLARAFYRLFCAVTGEDVPQQVASFRLISRRIVNAFLENRERYNLFMVIAAFSGFPYATYRYERVNRSGELTRVNYVDAVGRAISLLLLSSKRPLRIMTLGSLIGGLLSVFYGIYALLVHFLRDTVAEGWTSLSLQISGLFFLQFLILAVMSEYLIRVFVHSQNRLPYLIVKESSSMVLSRKVEINVTRAVQGGDADGPSFPSHEATERSATAADGSSG